MDSPKASDGGRFSIGLVVLGSAVVAATLVAGQTYLSMLHHGHDWWRLFSWQLISWSFWAALAPWLLSQGERALRAPRMRWIAANLGLCLLLVAVHIVISALALVWLQPFVPVESMGLQRALRYLLVPWAFIDLLVFWLVIASGNVLASQRRNRELAIRESRLETELARAQLEALRLQIQPHFLFNTLNSIAALVRKRANDQALEMVLGLSHLLRVTLDGSDDPFVTLEDELDFVNRYVDLHLQRFSDRLELTQEVARDCLDYRVPRLILQPLVENTIRHGISQSPSGGTIRLRARSVEPGRLEISIEDDGPGLPEGFSLDQSSGIGLNSVRARLSHLYGERARLRLRAREGGGTVAELSMPAEKEELRSPSSLQHETAGVAHRLTAGR